MAAYDSPHAALAAIVECLDGLCERVHVGSLNSGETLPCCPGCLLRVETAGVRVPDGQPRSMHNLVRCKPIILDVTLNYRVCFSVNTNSGRARPIDKLTADGTAIITSWWDVLGTLACCAPLNQAARFVSAADVVPDGQCAGWTMQLEVDVQLCGCA